MISIVIPTYNASNHIAITIEKLKILLEKYPFVKEIIFVNDNSTDNTLSILISLKNKYSNKIRILNLKNNFGQHPATLIGILHTKYEYCLTIDDDVLIDELDTEQYISAIETNNKQLIYLVRNEDIEKKFRFKIITTIFSCISKRKKISSVGSSQRFFNASYFKSNLPNSLSYIYLDVLFLLIGFQSTFRISNYSKHLSNHFRYSFLKRILLIFNSIIHYTSCSYFLPKKINYIAQLKIEVEEI